MKHKGEGFCLLRHRFVRNVEAEGIAVFIDAGGAGNLAGIGMIVCNADKGSIEVAGRRDPAAPDVMLSCRNECSAVYVIAAVGTEMDPVVPILRIDAGDLDAAGPAVINDHALVAAWVAQADGKWLGLFYGFISVSIAVQIVHNIAHPVYP